MTGIIRPVAKELCLCEEIDSEGGLVNVYGLFNAFHLKQFPHTEAAFSVFVQLSQGLGDVRIHFDITSASDGSLGRVDD